MIQKSGICGSLVCHDTHSTGIGGGESHRRPDLALVLTPDFDQAAKDLVWREVTVIGEEKPDDQDPCDHFSTSNETCREGWGQLAEYADRVFNFSHRMFVFAFILMPTKARLLYYCHSGVAYSEAIEWRKQPHFADFLWRLGKANKASLGIDPTVSLLKPGDPESDVRLKEARAIAEEKGLEQLPDGVDVDEVIPLNTPLWEFRVYDPKHKREFCLVAFSPRTDPRPLIGRFTRGYIAVDMENRRFVWLKDTWRVSLPGVPQEDETYRRLAANGVSKYLPGFLFGGDVPLNFGCPRSKDVEFQTTDLLLKLVQDHLDLYWRNVDDPPECDTPAWKQISLESNAHHRLVFEKIGSKLSRFPRTRVACVAVRDAAEGALASTDFLVSSLR